MQEINNKPIKPNQKTTKWYKPERIVSLSDAIFAFAMTLLVLTIDVPDVNSASELKNALLADLNSFYTYFLSFILLAVFWMLHHKLFDKIEKVNEKYVWLNIYNLIFIVFIPFSTELVGQYGDTFIASMIFHANMLIAGMFNYLLWYNAGKYDLLTENINIKAYQNGLKKALVMPAVALFAMALCFVTPAYSSFAYFLIPIVLSTGYFKKND